MVNVTGKFLPTRQGCFPPLEPSLKDSLWQVGCLAVSCHPHALSYWHRTLKQTDPLNMVWLYIYIK